MDPPLVASKDEKFKYTSDQTVAVMIPLCTLVILVIVGNLVVIIAVLKERHLRTPQNIYFVSLAFVDLLVGVIVLPLNIANQLNGWQWPYSITACKIYVTADISLCSMSIFHLCAIAEDRYRVVTQGVYYVHERGLLGICGRLLVIYVLSFWISSPPLLGWGGDIWSELEKHHDCKILDDPGYVGFAIFGSFFFPLVILSYFYLKIYRAIRSKIRSKQLSVSENLSEGNGVESSSHSTNAVINPPRKRSSFHLQLKDFLAKKRKFSVSRERRATKTLGMIMGAFVICWLPFSIMLIVTSYCHSCRSNFAIEFVTWLGYLNSALNPIIYTIFNIEFRKAFLSLFGC